MKIEPSEKVSKLKLVENNFERIKSAVLSEKSLSQVYVDLNFKSEMSEEEFVALSTMVYHKSKLNTKSALTYKNNYLLLFFLFLILGIAVIYFYIWPTL